MTGDHDQPYGSVARASATDVLSDMLRLVRLTGAMLFHVEASTPWMSWAPDADSFRRLVLPGAQHLISFHIITQGGGWAGLADMPPERLDAGDVVVVPHGDAYYLADPPTARARYGHEDAVAFFRDMAAGRMPSSVAEGGGGPDKAQFICGFLGCDVRPFNPLLSTLPRLLRVRLDPGGRAGPPPLVDYALQELRGFRDGGDAVRLRLAELLFVDVLRHHLAALPNEQSGWLAALRDPVVARALTLLHGAPAQGWTLDALAAQAGASRSVLAGRFTHLTGHAPMQYLRQLRMQLASRLLIEGDAKVAAAAAAVGFESEAAFSRAFKRCVGCSPAEWRRQRERAPGQA